MNLLIWPSPKVSFGALASDLAGNAGALTFSLESIAKYIRSTPVMFIDLGSSTILVPLLPIWPFSFGGAPQVRLADRIARVATIKVSPHKMVAYLNETITFIAMGSDVGGEIVQGAKFTWESSDTNKLTIDEAGRATTLRPGMVIVTSRAGSASNVARVLIKPNRRPVQTDMEWQADQDSLVSDAGGSGLADALASLTDRLAPTVQAQASSTGDFPNAWQQLGTPPFAQLEETRLGPVMPRTNFEIPIPLVSLGGRGMATNLVAYYNSDVWGSYFNPVTNGNVYVFDPIQSWPSPGFSLGFGRIVCYNGFVDPDLVSRHSFMLIDPNGTRHWLGVGLTIGNNTLQTADGSHITYVGNALGGMLHYDDGTSVTIGKVNNRLLPTQITDTNGNYIQIAYRWETNFPGIAISHIVDTLGRVISFNYGEWPSPPGSNLLTSINTPTGGVIFNYQSVTLNHSFQNEITVENAPESFYAVRSITVPARPVYNFSYSGYGMIYSISAGSAGGTATVTYDYPLGGEQLFGMPTFTHRTESPNSVYTYTWSEVTRPDGTTLSLSPGMVELRSSANQTLSKTEYSFTTDPGGSLAVESVTTTDDLGQQTRVGFDHDAYGNVVNKREYGFKVNGQWQIKRRTLYTYLSWQGYVDAYIRNRVTMVEVFDALNNINEADDVPVASTEYSYDNSMGGVENYGGLAAPPGHLPNYGPIGVITGVTKYTNVLAGTSVTQNSKIDIFGNTTVAQLDCCSQKSFAITEATYWSRPSQTTTGHPSSIYLTSSTGYDFNTLASTSQTDPNNQTILYSYDAAQRPTGFFSQTGASSATAYNVWGQPSATTTSYTEGSVNKTITTSVIYDGWGQITATIDANGARTNYGYDNMGRRLTQTNPFPQGGTPGPVTSYQYDQLGRAVVVTLPDGNTTQTLYTGGNMVTVTDQVNRKIKRETDGLGRLVRVTEQNVSNGQLSQETTYAYDAADRLIGVNQGNQTRAYKYDDAGRLLYERMPEMNATMNDGTGAVWSLKYTYTSSGSLHTKTDARGVITTHGYDSLNRLTSVTYNTSGAPGVASTPPVTYTYDNNQSSTTKGLLLSVNAGSGYSESYSYDAFKRLQSVTRTIDGRSYTTSQQFNTANQPTQLSYPSGRVLSLGHDNKGRLTSVGSFLTGVTYNAIGQLTGTTLGNGVTETYSYDPNRMQLTSQTATKGGGPSNGLMNLAYGYGASAGQMGAGSLAGNADQLTTISGTIGGLSESAAYSYDNLARLVTSNQSSNGSSAQRRFAYDRWGNRTGVWDAVSGGNQIQTITLEQNAGVPTNRVQTVTPGNPVNTNVALPSNGATVTASSTYSTDYPASGVTNSDRKGLNWGTGGGWMDATSSAFPDWIQVNFGGTRTINEIDVFTVQDDFENPAEPTQTMTFSQYGIVDFKVQYWNGFSWQTVQAGDVTDNNKVWRKFNFSPVQTDKVRVHITKSKDAKGRSKLVEVEAWAMIAGTNNYVYDASGNVTNDGPHNYAYDAVNRLVSVDGGATAAYSYDRLNQRYRKTTGGATTHYIWRASQVIAEHNGSTGALLVDYVYSGNRMIAKVESGVTQYLLTDRLSTRLTLDASGNVLGRQGHLPFGEDFAESGTQEKHHLGKYERDANGIDYALNRHYSSSIGRFIQRDPYNGSCSRGTPQSNNRYPYVENDPVNRADPLGLTWRLVGCTTYPDGFGSCTACWMQDDENDTIRSVVTCDSPRWEVHREPPIRIEEGPVVDKPEGGGRGGIDDGCGACCARVWDECFAAHKTRVTEAGGSRGAKKIIKKCLGRCILSAPRPEVFQSCFNQCLVEQLVENLQELLKSGDEFIACIQNGGRECAEARNGECACPR